MTAGKLISAGIIAGEIEPTGNNTQIGHQVRMNGAEIRLYITPEVAAQWLPVIQKIAEGK